MDLVMQFNRASRAVAEQLFVSFYRPPVSVGSEGLATRKLTVHNGDDDDKAAEEGGVTTLSTHARK